MGKSHTIRSFLKTNLQAGLASVAVTSLFLEIIRILCLQGKEQNKKKEPDMIGNISELPVDGKAQRYPLQIIEIDEDIICFKKDTMTIIDDRDPARDSESLQLSNYSMLEYRETKEIEIYLTRLGERGGGANIWTADTYKYTLRLLNKK